MNNNRLTDGGNDKRYFTITPRLVQAYSRDTYDYTLWGVIKGIAGESGECIISTPDLATLAMMSTGKVSDCRKYLIECGLLQGSLHRDPGYPQPVWHLKIPDLWSENIEWAEAHPTIASRIGWKKSFHGVKARELSPGEKGITTGEKGTPPGETKKNHIEEPLEDPLPAPSAQGTEGKPPGFEQGEDGITYEPLDEEGGNGRHPKWATPETTFQRNFLAVCGAKWFKSKQKTAVKALAKAFEAGDQAPDPHKACADALADIPELFNKSNHRIIGVLPPMPQSWFEWRETHARQNRWSVWGFISALLDRDALMRHCQIHMKKAGVPVALAQEEDLEVNTL
jgi:hypothetical protein